MRKLYVIDTSVLIHDPECLYKFIGNDVAIPIFVIIELDDLKERKNSNTAFASRCASRTIQNIHQVGGGLHNGVYLKDQDINIKIIGTTGGVGIKALQENNNPRKMDLWILQCALSMKEEYEEVVLVTKDLNLRLLAEGEGLTAEDYETNLVPLHDLYTGFRDVGEQPNSSLVYIPNSEVLSSEFVSDPIENEFYISSHKDKKFLFKNEGGMVCPVEKDFNISISPRNLEQRMAIDLLMNPDISLVSLVGKAGTGKTILALACALAQLHVGYDKILLSKPIVDMGNSLGFLPGELDEKLAPWMASFFDNLDQLIPAKSNKDGRKKVPHWKYLLDTEAVVMQPINSIRGRSISNSYMIIDEAQNLTPHEIKTLITRAAEGTKVILMGDPFQVDAPFLDQNSNGLTYVTQKMCGSSIFGAVFFSQGVRSALAEEAATLL